RQSRVTILRGWTASAARSAVDDGHVVLKSGGRARRRTVQPQPRQDAELNELRRKYEDLCARLMEQTARDPVSEGAIIEELQRLSDQIVALAQEADMNGPSGHGKGTAGSPGDHPAGTHQTDPSLGKVLALLERQSRDVERILRRSDEHRDQLERVERRLVETMPLIERQLPEL